MKTRTKLTETEMKILKEYYPPFCPHTYNDLLVGIYLSHDWLLRQWLEMNEGVKVRLTCLLGEDEKFRRHGRDDEEIARLTSHM